MDGDLKATCAEVNILYDEYRRRTRDPEDVTNQLATLLSQRAQHLQFSVEHANLVPQLAVALGVLAKRRSFSPAVTSQLGTFFQGYLEHTRSVTKHVSSSAFAATANSCASVVSAAIALESTARSDATFPFATLLQSGLDTSMKFVHSADPSGVEPQSYMHLLEGSAVLRGKNHKFGRAQVGSFGLLPVKAKRDMESKVMRCTEARELLGRLHDKTASFSLVDALRCLQTLSRTGLYHPDLASRCCDVIDVRGGVSVRPPHLVSALFHLGTLGHRSPHQRTFLSRISLQDLNVDSMSLLLQGMAMLHQPPVDKDAVHNRVFAFALRGRNAAESEAPHWRWFVDVTHALHELRAPNHKLLITAARNIRNNIHDFEPVDAMKALFTLGGEATTNVPEDLMQNWGLKVTKCVNAIVQRSERFQGLSPMDTATMALALRGAGVKSHALLPSTNEANTSDAGAALRSLWSSRPGVAPPGNQALSAQKTPEEMTVALKAVPSDELADTLTRFDARELAHHRREVADALALKMEELSAGDALRILHWLDEKAVTQHYTQTARRLADQIASTSRTLGMSELQAAVALFEKLRLPGKQALVDVAFSRLQPQPPM